MRHACRLIVLASVTTLLCTPVFPTDRHQARPERAFSETEPRAATGQVNVTVEGFESTKGQVLVSLYLDDSGWPGDEARAFAARRIPIAEDLRARVEFDDVPAGSFAVSVVHDKNRNRKLDRGLFGIPREPYGFSRDARSTFHAPSFSAAQLQVAAGESTSITIHVR